MSAPTFALEDFALAFGDNYSTGQDMDAITLAMNALDDAKRTAVLCSELHFRVAGDDERQTQAVEDGLANLEYRLDAALKVLGKLRKQAMDPAKDFSDTVSENPTEPQDAPADASLVLDRDDRQNLLAALRRMEQGILDLAAGTDDDGTGLAAVASSARVFRWELKMGDLESEADHG